MANLNGNIDTLKPYESKWVSGKTMTIRVPIAIAPQVLEFARTLDRCEPLDTVNDVSAADILQRLRRDRKKSKADLADVEAILQMLGE